MRLPTYKKELIIKKALKKEESIAFLSRKYGIARKTIYSWIKTYKSAPSRIKSNSLETKYIKGKRHPREYRHTLKDSLIRLVIKNPELNITEISKSLKAGRHAIYNLLKDLNLTCKVDRLNFSKLYKHPGVLDSEIKLSIVRAVVNCNESVTNLSKTHNIARKTIYEWVKRYKEEGELKEKYISGFEHPRAYSASTQDTILNKVIKNPALSIHSLSKELGLSSHGVYNVLKRYSLTYKAARIAYSQERQGKLVKPASTGVWNKVKSVFESFMPSRAPAPPPFSNIFKAFFGSFATSFVISSIFILLIRTLSQANGASHGIGLFFAFSALLIGSFFFLYSFKYYITLAIVLSFSQADKNPDGNNKSMKGLLSWLMGNSKEKVNTNIKRAVGLEPNLDYVHIKKHPFISVHIPFYNEKNVVERSIEAATNFDYKGEYEVILCDDSNDETSTIIREYQKKCLLKNEKLKIVKGDGWVLTSVEVRPGVILKHIHRTNRVGYKGAALELARKLSNPKTEFISVFDADFVPYPDSLELFLKYFKVQNNMSENYKASKVGAVQGYQWHVLNKSENWITRGVRSEYAGSYVIERSGAEIYGGLKQISGSVYMIRKDVLDEIGWKTSITEDFELTLSLYEKGYKVVYTPYIQAPAECVSTTKRLIRQRMRWAEGHSQNIKKMFKKLIFSPSLSFSEKLELLYLSPYYLQAFFFLIGTLAWFLSETVFPARLPFWTELWGWSLVLTNVLSLPLVNSVGLFLEESEEKDYLGLASFIVLSYILVPFQAYAAFKGFLENEEGPWFRTPKTGKITDIFTRGRFYRFISGIFPGKESPVPSRVELNTDLSLKSSYLGLVTANNQFNDFKVKPKRYRFLGNLVLTLILGSTFILSSFGTRVKTGSLADLPIQTRVEKLGEDTTFLSQFSNIFSPKEVLAATEKAQNMVVSSVKHISVKTLTTFLLLILFIIFAFLIHLYKRKRKFFKKAIKLLLVFTLVLSWLFTSWPPIWKNPQFPPKIRDVQAVIYTKSLLHMNGSDASTTFTDESGKSWTSYGAELDTAQKKFGTASGLFSNSELDTGDSDDFRLDGASNSKEWTVDFWVRFNGDPSGTTQGFFQYYNYSGTNINLLYNGTALEVLVRSGGSTVIDITNTWDPAADTWYHVAFVKQGTTGYKFFVDGTQIGTTQTDTDTMPDPAGGYGAWLGNYYYSGSHFLNGWLDEFRISKGIARWTSNFTPPTSEYVIFEQSAYRWFENDNSTSVGSPIVVQDTAMGLSDTPAKGTPFRLRVLLHIDYGTLASSGQNLKLQIAEKVGASCDTDMTTTDESYSDLVTTTGGIRYYNNSTPADNAALTSSVNDPSHSGHTTVTQSYKDLDGSDSNINLTNSVAAIADGQDGEWDFTIINNSTTVETTYCLRIVKSDGSLLETYTVVPEFTTVPENSLLLFGLYPLVVGFLKKLRRKKLLSKARKDK